MRRYGFIVAALAALAVGVPLAGADPPAPAIVSSTPASPANGNAPTLVGTAASLTLVHIYAGSGCVGDVAASGPADLAGNFALPVNVPDDSATTFSANATDGVTTSACSNDFTYVEDSMPPPAPTITSHPATITNETTPSFSFSGEAGASFQCRLGSDPFSACASPQGYNLSQGAYTFEVRAIDAAGNAGASSQFTWTIDTTPPPSPPSPAGRTPPATTRRRPSRSRTPSRASISNVG